jgi:hypothetical protein
VRASEDRCVAQVLQEVLPKPVGRGARPRCHSTGLSVEWAQTPERFVLVRSLLGLASDVEVEELNSEVAQEAMNAGMQDAQTRR